LKFSFETVNKDHSNGFFVQLIPNVDDSLSEKVLAQFSVTSPFMELKVE